MTLGIEGATTVLYVFALSASGIKFAVNAEAVDHFLLDPAAWSLIVMEDREWGPTVDLWTISPSIASWSASGRHRAYTRIDDLYEAIDRC